MPLRSNNPPRAITALLLFFMLPGCGNQAERSVPGPPPEAVPPRVESRDAQMPPGSLLVIEKRDPWNPVPRAALVTTVEPGGRVIWENRDSKDHTITSPVGLWDSGRLRPGERFERQFNDPGEFSFISVYDREVSGTIYAEQPSRGGNPAEEVKPDEPTVENAGVPSADLKLTLVPEWPSITDVDQAFRLIHEEPVLQSPGAEAAENRKIRLPWSFIEDGCAPRAAIAAELIEARGWRRPAKLFAFGTLALEREGGIAFWWYHVALVVRVGDQALVLDPAVEPTGALALSDWLSRIAWPDPASVTLSVCNAFAYEPWSRCYVSGPEDEAGALDEVMLYLPPENAGFSQGR